jgi:hypothetical protein
MTDQNALAAGQGGDPSSLASPSQVPETTSAPTPDDDLESDETLRRRGASFMAQHLESATGLIERCEYLALQPKGDRMRPLYAAAQLMRANARVAQALGQLAQVERRQHTIVERIQPPAPILRDSNSDFRNSDPQGVLIDALLDKMLRYMKLIADQKLGPALKEADAHEKENSAAAAEAAETPA